MIKMKQFKHGVLTICATSVITSCQTAKTGGKIVDEGRKEIILSSSSDPRSALPAAEKDSSVSKARERLEATIKANPRDVKALITLAELQLAQNRLTQSEATCRKALLVDLKNKDARRILAHIAIRQGNFKLAEIFLTALGSENSKDSSILNMLGLISYHEKDYGNAMRLWKNAINLNSGDISARMNLGIVYLKNRLYQKASAQFERVLKVAPSHQDARLHLAIVEASQGQYEKALEIYESLLSQDRNNQLALFNLAVTKKNLGSYDEAVAGLKAFIKSNQEKSSSTDAAFALLEDINVIKSSNGEKISDDDLQVLANELASRQLTLKNRKNIDDKTKAAKQSTATMPSKDSKKLTQRISQDNSNQSNRAVSEASEDPNADDQDIEALEKQLKSPAH